MNLRGALHATTADGSGRRVTNRMARRLRPRRARSTFRPLTASPAG